MTRFGFGFVLVGVFAVATAAQDTEAIEIKVSYPKAGQRVKVTVEEKATTKTTFTVDGNTQNKDEVKSKSLVYVDDVIENPKNEKRATKLKRTYEKAAAGKDGNAEALPIEGKTVLIEKSGEKYAFTVDGRGVTGESLRLLEDEFNKPKQGDTRDQMFPKNAVKPGETWKIPTEELIKALGDGGLTLDKDKVSATGKLVKAYKKDGRQYGVIEITVDGPIASLGEKSPLTVKSGKMVLKLAGEGCLDGSIPTGNSTMAMTFDILGTTQGIDLKIVVEQTEKRTMEVLKK